MYAKRDRGVGFFSLLFPFLFSFERAARIRESRRNESGVFEDEGRKRKEDAYVRRFSRDRTSL